ncbi:MAG: lipid A export permease/ATP-binding protein MsbA [Cellvibrionaceae bacterium]
MSTDQPSMSASQLYLKLLVYIKPFWFMFGLGILGNVIFALSQAAFAELMRYMTGAIGVDPMARWLIPAFLVGIFIVRGLGSFIGDYGFTRVAFGVVHQLRLDLFNHITYLPGAAIEKQNSSELVSRITFDSLQVTQSVTNSLKTLVREGATVIVLMAYLLWINWLATSVFIIIAPLVLWCLLKVSKRLRKLAKSIQHSMGDLTHVCAEMINNFRVMRIFGGEEYEKERFAKASRHNAQQNIKRNVTSAAAGPLIQLFAVIALAVLVFLALSLMKEATAGDILAYITAAALIPQSMRKLGNILGSIQKGVAAADSIFNQLDEPLEENIQTGDSIDIKGKVEFDRLSFAYADDAVALKDISFTVEAGKTVALVGRSGSGKTTLANLIPRFLSHQQGRLLIDGHPIENLSLKSLRSQIALVNQNITLFNDTLAKNIAYGDMHNASEEEIIAAAKKANAWEFIEKLPEGLQTVVGENGTRLSGGQRQRIAIARALLKDAPILILDEGTSALDTESERHIQRELQIASKGRTTIVIAHRLSTIENADSIVVMDQGSLVEQGTHKKLLSANGHYAQLYQQGFSEVNESPEMSDDNIESP